MSEFRLNVIAETQKAERALQKVDKVADAATRERKLEISLAGPEKISKQFSNIKSNVKEAANDIKQFYTVFKNVPVVGNKIKVIENLAKNTVNLAKSAPSAAKGLVESGKASNVLATSTQAASKATLGLVDKLARAGLAFYAVKEAIGLLQSAYTGFFNETIGREIQLQETILKTQTALASTGKVFSNGVEIVSPLEKIEALTGQVEERIESIRERSLELAGVTSNDVIEVFGIVAQEVQAIGGGLEDAEDLAIQFSAALGTFGIPLFQARQEIGSILRGDITQDSYLAKALGITNEDVEKAKSTTEGVIGFLGTRLEASVAGQAIAAKSFAGVTSNIAEIFEEVNRAFGQGLLTPLLDGLTVLYDNLFGIFKQLKDIAAESGKAVGKLLTVAAVGIGGSTNVDLSGIASALQNALKSAFSAIQNDIVSTLTPLQNIFQQFTNQVALLAIGLKDLAVGFADISIESFKALVQLISNIASLVTPLVAALGQILSLYGDILKLPGVQYFAQLATTFKALEVLGVTSLIKLGFAVTAFVGSWASLIATVQRVRIAITTALAAILRTAQSVAANVAGIIAGLVVALATLGTSTTKLRAELETLSASFNKIAVSAGAASGAASRFGGAVATVGGKVKGAILGLVAVAAKLFAIQLVITVVIDLFGRFQKRLDNLAQDRRAEAALKRLESGAYDAADGLTAAQRALKELDEAEVRIKFDRLKDDLGKAVADLEKFKEDTKDLLDPAFAELKSAKIAQAELDKLQKRVDFITRALNELDERSGKAERDEAITFESNQRTNLEKEIGQLRRQIDTDLFNQRQSLARKEVEIFRAAGDLRIQQIQRANEKLIEGEEGASRAALEALNTYIATRENGELAIEAAKKNLAIEAANLGKAASDYRFNIEKKIFELRKKSADYEKDAANKRLNQLNGATAPLVQLIAQEESFGGNYGAFNRGGRDAGRTPIGSGVDPNLVNLKISEIQRRQTEDLFAVGKYQIIPDTLKGLLAGQYGPTGVTAEDKFTPENQDKLFKALVRNRIVAGDVEATIKGLRQEWIGLQDVADSALREAVKPLVSPVAVPATAAPSGSTAGIPDSEAAAGNFEKATADLTAASNNLLALQAQAASASTAKEFESIAKALFPKVALEQYQDRLIGLGFQYEALGKSADQAFDPARSAIEIDRLTQIAVKAREVAQTQASIAKNSNVDAEERNRLFADFASKNKTFLADLEKEARLKQNILSTEQAVQFATDARTSIQNIKDETEAIKLRNQLIAEGASSEVIDARVRQLEISRQVERSTSFLNELLTTQLDLRAQLEQKIAGAEGSELEKLQKDLAASQAEVTRLQNLISGTRSAGAGLAAAQDERAAALNAPGAQINSFINAAKQQLEDYEGLAVRVSQNVGNAIGNSLTNGISGLIEGTTTIKTVFSDFLKEIGSILLKESAKIISTYIAIGLAKKFAGLLGVDSGGGPLSTDFLQGVNNPLNIADSSAFNLGGFFADGGIPPINRPSIVGERGPELFVPFQQGTIVSNEDLQEQMAKAGVSSMERSSSSRFRETREVMVPFTRSAEQLSVASAERETAQAISNPEPLDVRFESQVINNVEYVTADQYRKGMSQAAERGRALTLEALQNSVKARKRIGL